MLHLIGALQYLRAERKHNDWRWHWSDILGRILLVEKYRAKPGKIMEFFGEGTNMAGSLVKPRTCSFYFHPLFIRGNDKHTARVENRYLNGNALIRYR